MRTARFVSNFGFLRAEFPAPFESAARAESLVYPDPRVSCFYARRALELAVAWLYRHDSALKLPYQDHLSALIHEPTFRDTVGATLHAKVRVIKDLGNLAVHSTRAVREIDALTAVRELFHFSYWLARTYGRTARPAPGIIFDPKLLPRDTPAPPQTLAQLQRRSLRRPGRCAAGAYRPAL